jgi:hypothetical protein
MKLFYSITLAILSLTSLIVTPASTVMADEPSWTISCKSTYPFSSLLTAAIQARVLNSIDLTQFSKPSASVRLRLIKPVNLPVEISNDTALNGTQLIPDPHASGLAFSIQGSADLRATGQCVYNYVVSITTHGTNLATNLPFTTSTESTLQVIAPTDGAFKKHVL